MERDFNEDVSNSDDVPIKDTKDISNSDDSTTKNAEDFSNSDDSPIKDAKHVSNLDDSPIKDARDVSNSDDSPIKDARHKDVSNSNDSPIKNAEDVSNLDDSSIKDAKDDFSNSDYFKVKDENDDELLNYEEQMILFAQQQSLEEAIKKNEQRLCEVSKSLEEAILRNQQFLDNNNNYLIGSPTLKFQDLPDSSTLPGSLRYTATDLSDNLEDLSKQSKNISEALTLIKTEINQCESNLPLETAEEETPESGPCNASRDRFTAPPDIKTTESNEISSRSTGYKGKEAANKLYRYKKRSKTVSAGESLEKDTPITCSGHVVSTPELESHQNQQNNSPKEGLNRISPAVKRKISDSDELNLDRRQLDDSDVSKIAKKLKFEGEETSGQFPIIKPLPSKNLQSSSGLSTKGDFVSTSEEWPLESGIGDDRLSEEGLSSNMRGTDDSLSEEGGSSHMSGTDGSLFEEESSQMSVSDEDGLSERKKSFHRNISEDDRDSDRGEPSRTSLSDEQHSERGESPLISVVKDASLSENDEPQD